MNNTFLHTLPARLVAFVAAVLAAGSVAAEDITVKLSDLQIAPGETKKVEVSIDNAMPVGTTITGDVVLPAGLEMVKDEDDEYFTADYNRCYTSHSITSAKRTDKGTYYRFTIIGKKSIKGNSGTVFSFQVKAAANMADDGEITYKYVVSNDKDVRNSFQGTAVGKVHNSSAAAPARVLFSLPDFELTPSKEYTLEFNLENNTPVTAFQIDFKLPQGLTMLPDEEDEYATLATERISKHVISGHQQDDGDYRVSCYSTKNFDFKGESGTVFTVKVKADATLAASSEIAISGVVISDHTGKAYEPADFTVSVTNPDVAAKAEAEEQIKSLKDNLAKVEKDIDGYLADVQAAMADKEKDVEDMIDDIESTLAANEATGDIAANTEARGAAVAEAQAAIDALAKDAAAMQATGISTVTTAAAATSAKTYDLNGRVTLSPKGVVIRGGHKVIVK